MRVSTPTPEDLQRTQRRGRVVIVTMIALFLLVCVILGVFLWQRQQEENRFAALQRTGLITAGAPDWGYPIASVEPLERNLGLVVRYDQDGEVYADSFRAVNVRAGADPDPCALLAQADPAFTEPDRCEVDGTGVSAAVLGPEDILHAEGQVRADTLLVLISPPAHFTPEELQVWLGATEMDSVRALFERIE